MLFNPRTIPLVADRLPKASLARDLSIRDRHILIRPYAPAGFHRVPGTDVTIFLERNPNFPRVWGWCLAINPQDYARDPELRPGCMVIFKRFAEEFIDWDQPLEPRYLGHQLAICAIHIDSLEASIDPPKISLEV